MVIRDLPLVVEASHMAASYDYSLQIVPTDVGEWTLPGSLASAHL